MSRTRRIEIFIQLIFIPTAKQRHKHATTYTIHRLMVHEFMIQTPPLQLIMFILLCYRYMLIVYYWFTWKLNVQHSAAVGCRNNEREEKN